MSKPCLRLATESDLVAINEIYNHYVLHSTCTYQIEPETLPDRQAWFHEHHPNKYPVIVAECDADVVGWGSLSKWRPRAAAAPTAEATVYIRHDKHRCGIGQMILSDLIQRARQIGFHSIIGSVGAEQTASIGLQESLGFQRVACMKQVARKFDQWLDLVCMQLML